MQSLYIHIPFCESKCHYCSFNSVAGEIPSLDAYVQALILEIEQEKRKQTPLKTLFFGGGTPSLLAPWHLFSLIKKIRSCFLMSSQTMEISLEANPGTLTEEKLKGYWAAGVNRISLGAQSFQEEELTWLGRTHQVKTIKESVKRIKQAGCDNFNLDLIFGLPGQSIQKWEENLERALELRPTHLSLYQLTVEEGSLFYHQIPGPSDEDGAAFYQQAQSCLEQAGFKQYEISNFALPGYECQHNQTYWRNEDCLGMGAGAWSYVEGVRYVRPKTIKQYIEDVRQNRFARLEEEKLNPRDALRETLVLGLRMNEGVDLSALSKRWNQAIEKELLEKLKALQEKGLLLKKNGKVSLTQKGILFADTVAVELL